MYKNKNIFLCTHIFNNKKQTNITKYELKANYDNILKSLNELMG